MSKVLNSYLEWRDRLRDAAIAAVKSDTADIRDGMLARLDDLPRDPAKSSAWLEGWDKMDEGCK